MALAYMLCLYESYWLHILGQKLGTKRVKNHWKVARCVIANTRKGLLVLVDFQNDYYSINYQII